MCTTCNLPSGLISIYYFGVSLVLAQPTQNIILMSLYVYDSQGVSYKRMIVYALYDGCKHIMCNFGPLNMICSITPS